MQLSRALAILAVPWNAILAEAQTDYHLPESVTVLPVFFVPDGGPEPDSLQVAELVRHLDWAQEFYAEHLPDANTFQVAPEAPIIVHGAESISYYSARPESGVPAVVGELLRFFGVNRYSNRYIFLTVWMNPEERFPVGGGRPLNGGFNTGGGIVVISSYALDNMPMFQSTVRHELGHAFGLPHVDVYGYDMDSNPSVMSYKQSHWTNFFDESPDPGEFIAEDQRGLALNERVFGGLRRALRLQRDYSAPDGFPIWLGPMEIDGQPPARPSASTVSGETWGSSVSNTVDGIVRPSAGPGVTYDQRTMWTSAESETGQVSLTVTFPFAVTLDRVVVHSQHSGIYHAAIGAEISVAGPNGFTSVVASDLKDADAAVRFPPTIGTVWRFRLATGPSRMVVIRELEFFDAGHPVLPVLVPSVDKVD